MAEKKNTKDYEDDDKSSTNSSDSEFESKDNAEDFEDYKVDGYHPVTLGEVFNGKYQVVQKLGWGHFSTVWLVNEKKTPNYFALKIQKSKKSYSESAVDELEILKALTQSIESPEWMETRNSWNEKYNLTLQPFDTFNIRLNDNFCHFGMHGKHYCSVFEIMGPTLLDIIQHFEDQDIGMDIRLVKIITRQILMGLDYMHRVCKVIHTDLKPENIMLELHGKQLEEFISDLKEYKKKPLSMKFLKKLQTTSSNKNKKKQLKKKMKKQQKKQAQQTETEGGEPTTQAEEITTTEEVKGTAQELPTEPLPNILNTLVQNSTENLDAEVKVDQAKEDNKENIPEAKEKEGTASKEEKPVLKEVQTNKTQEEEEVKIDANGESDPENWSYALKWKGHINVKLDKNIRIKIVDFGNGCWTHKHFTDNIQTREYRSPEALLGSPYQENTDIWSLACVVFEMLTSNYLFKPKKGDTYSKNDDHLALMLEHLGKMPKAFALKGKYSREYFNKNGQLLKIKELRETTIAQALVETELISEKDALEIEQFLLPMLEYEPEKRISAQEALKSEWLWN